MIPTLPITISDLSPYPQHTSRNNNNKNKKKSLVFLFVLFLLCLFTAFYLIRYMILSSPSSLSSYNHAQTHSDNNINNNKQEAGEGETTCSLKTSSANAINKASLLSREDVGRATWKFLHILAQHANNMDNNKMDNNNNNNNNILGDTDKEKKMNELLHLVSQLFPCPTCAADFQLILNQHPFSLMKTQFIHNNNNNMNNINKNNNSNSNNNKYTMKHYVCDLHNIVNQKLNKPLYDCNNEQQLTQQYAMSECF